MLIYALLYPYCQSAADMLSGGGGGSGGGAPPPTFDANAARAYVSEFVSDPESVKTMAEPDLQKLHGRLTAAVTKYAPRPSDPDPNKPWFENFKDPATKEWMTAMKGAYPDAESLASKAYNLEKFMGAEKAGRGVIVPKADATPEEWKMFWGKVAPVPEKPEGYAVPKDLDPKIAAELEKDPMLGKFREFAHKAGIPAQFAQPMLSWYGQMAFAMENDSVKTFEAEAAADMENLKKEWVGVEFDKNVELGRRAARAFIPHKSPEELKAFINNMTGAIGQSNTFKFLAAIGKGMGEDTFVEGERGVPGVSTPEAARLKIAELKADKVWSKSFVEGDAEKRAEWVRLHKVAYPDDPAQK